MVESVKVVFWDEKLKDVCLSYPTHKWTYEEWCGEWWMIVGVEMQKGDNLYYRTKRWRMEEIKTLVMEYPVVTPEEKEEEDV